MLTRTKRPVEQRFWEKVDRLSDDLCWIWKGAKGFKGYGLFWIDGKLRPAHQVAWEIHNSTKFPFDKIATHSCNIPSCVNPKHIIPGTHSQNLRDAYRDGLSTPHSPTAPTGENHHNGRKIHCSNGHEFTKKSEYGKKRSCGKCSYERTKATRAKFEQNRLARAACKV